MKKFQRWENANFHREANERKQKKANSSAKQAEAELKRQRKAAKRLQNG